MQSSRASHAKRQQQQNQRAGATGAGFSMGNIHFQGNHGVLQGNHRFLFRRRSPVACPGEHWTGAPGQRIRRELNLTGTDTGAGSVVQTSSSRQRYVGGDQRRRSQRIARTGQRQWSRKSPLHRRCVAAGGRRDSIQCRRRVCRQCFDWRRHRRIRRFGSECIGGCFGRCLGGHRRFIGWFGQRGGLGR